MSENFNVLFSFFFFSMKVTGKNDKFISEKMPGLEN